MKKIIFLLSITISFIFSNELDDILKKVQQDSVKQAQENKQKELFFLKKKQEQEQILQDIKAKIEALEKQNDKNEQIVQTQNEQIIQLQETLSKKSVNLNELFGTAKQAANDLYASTKNSLLRAQYPLDKNLLNLANSKKLPNAKELETLWSTYLKEIVNSSKILSFQTPVILKDGSTKTLHVNRIGTFTAFTNNNFLDYKDNNLIEYPKQPSLYTQYLQELKPNTGLQNIVIDPTKGSLLNMESLKPSVIDRVHQAGSVGYVIIFLGIFGALVALFQLIRLFIISHRVKKQANNLNNINDKNPLGRVLLAINDEENEKQLESKLSHAVLKESSKISSIKSLVKLLASVAPMLGLLGTVIGMIATFQAITLFGTGEPQLMADGISQALITTVLGLIVAIPLLFLYALLNAKSHAILQIIYEQSAGMVIHKTK